MIEKNVKNMEESARYLRSRLPEVPDTALVLGSGLGDFAELLEKKQTVFYGDIPHFPVSTAPGHAGRFVLGAAGGKPVLVMQGRIHFYEGYSMDEVAYPVRVMKLLGIKRLFLTNAAGSINPEYQVGDLVMISDHIKFFQDSPLRGQNIETFGVRFPDMSDAYTKSLRALAGEVAKREGIPLREGVYSYMPGPNFETPAEIRMLRTLGADVVGMSTVPEVLCAVHCGMQVFALSFVTNLAAGLLERIQELRYTPNSRERFNRLIVGMLGAV